MLNGLAALIMMLAASGATLDTSALSACGTVTGAEAVDGARFRTGDGETVKLALLKAPEYWETGTAYRSWPHARAAKDRLAALVTGQTVALWCEGAKSNAEGERVAHGVLADGRWLQAVLVADGAAFVFPRPTRRTGLEALYALESAARTARAGLWAFKNLAPVEAADSRAVRSGWFQIIEGTVMKADKVGPTVYLNFGEDWRTDATIEIPAPAQRHFAAAGIDPLTFAGKRIEARGWIDFKSGPRLVVQGPGQIRLKGAD